MSPTGTVVVNISAREEYDIYIGRGSLFGNPYVVGGDGTRAECLAWYRTMAEGDPDILNNLETLRGKRLGCHCKPLDCHGDILIAMLEARDVARAA